MWPTDPAQAELVEKARVDLNAARSAFDAAKDFYDRESQRAEEIGLNTADGAHLPLIAAQRYNFATKAYGDALRRFAQLVHDLRKA